jgi:hypothetical protein
VLKYFAHYSYTTYIKSISLSCEQVCRRQNNLYKSAAKNVNQFSYFKGIIDINLSVEQYKQKKGNACFPFIVWSCRESNPGPNIFAVSFLHVYSVINCRDMAGTRPTNHILRCVCLKQQSHHPAAAPCFVLSRRRHLVTG